jgi:hypothetical protein
MNPYDWNRPDPQVEIPRGPRSEIVELLRRGRSAVLLAGRGSGKTVFLQQIQRVLEEFPDVRPVLFSEPPAERTVRACFDELARKLDVPATGALTAKELVDAYLTREVPRSLVLLYDELDRYARPHGGPGADPPGRDFFNSLETMRQHTPGVGILAASSIGYFLFRDQLGSSFVSRAEKWRLLPFDREQLAELARPFEENGRPVSFEALEALYLASGGNAALATYGLENLWPRRAPTERDVTEAFAGFQDRNSEFLRSFQLSFADPSLSEAPQRVWDLIRQSDGRVSRASLLEACNVPESTLLLDIEDVLDLLAAAGLVRIRGSVRASPVTVRPINSILSLPSVPVAAPDLQEQLRRDLGTLLHRLHVSSADFFRPGEKGKQLVPEAVFAAFLALGFELLGWQVDREAQRGAGRTDLLLRRSRSAVAIIETKIWGRNDYRKAHRQVASYWSIDTVAGAVVQLTDAELPQWPRDYRRQCLEPFGIDIEEHEMLDSPIRARFDTSGHTSDGTMVRVNHFLLRLPRRS